MEKKTSDEEILEYLDGLLDEQQSLKLEARFQQSSAMRTRLEELRLIHNTLQSGARLESPSINFTQRVMKQLESMPAVRGISPKNGLLLLGGIIVAIGVALILLQSGKLDAMNGTISLDTIPIKKEWFKSPLPSIPFSSKVVINVLLIVATGLSLILLDRTILRPLFERRSGMI